MPGGKGRGRGGVAAADTWWIGRKHCVKGDRSLLLLSELRTAERLVVVLGWWEGGWRCWDWEGALLSYMCSTFRRRPDLFGFFVSLSCFSFFLLLLFSSGVEGVVVVVVLGV